MARSDPGADGVKLNKPTRSAKELTLLVAEAMAASLTAQRVAPAFAPAIEAHIRDGLGRNWDVNPPAPTPAHRKAIDGVRDAFDLL